MIGTATAILASAAIAAGGSLIASNNAAKAAKQAGQQQADAAAQAQQLQYQIFQQQRADAEPFRQIGLGAASALSSQFGLGPRQMSGQAGGRTQVVTDQGFGGYTPRPSTGGGQPVSTTMSGLSTMPRTYDASSLPTYDPNAPVDPSVYSYGAPAGGSMTGRDPYAAYKAANPDLAAEAARVTADGEFPSEAAYFQWHDQQYANEGRPSSVDPVQPTQPTEPTQVNYGQPDEPGGPAPGYTDPTASDGYTMGPRPDVGPAPAPYVAPERQDFGPAPTRTAYGPAPTRQEYAPLDVSLNSYQHSPGYEFRQKEAARTIDNAASTMGRVMSGARLKALQERSSDIANQDYTDWRDYTTGQYNVDRSRYDNVYAQDYGAWERGQARGDQIYAEDLGQWNVNRGRADTIYEADRGFGYGQSRDAYGDWQAKQTRSDGLYADDQARLDRRYDTRNNTLLSMAGFGTGANAQNASAAQSFAQNQSQLMMTGAQAKGNAAINAANAWTNGMNNLLTTGAYLGGRFMTGGTGKSSLPATYDI